MPRVPTSTAFLFAVLLTAGACIDAPDADTDADACAADPASCDGDGGGEAGTGGEGGGGCAPRTGGDWTGAYAIEGTWDLSGPLAGDTGLGDLLADLVVTEAVGLLGVPGVLEDDAADLLDEVLGDAIRDAVNGSAPDARLRQDPFMRAVLGFSARSEVASRLDLERGTDPNNAVGREELSSITVRHDGSAYTLLTPSELAGDQPATPIAAAWRGTEAAGTLTIAEHGLAFEYGRLLTWMIDEALGADARDAFADRVVAAVDCASVVAAVSGPDMEIEVSVGGVGASVGVEPLVETCEAELRGIVSALFGALAIDTGVVVGGTVLAIDTDCDDISEELESVDFGGFIDVGPGALAPRVDVGFYARRAPRAARRAVAPRGAMRF